METGEKEKELGIDVLRVYMVFYIKSHGNLCAGFLFAVLWSFGWFGRFSRWWCVFSCVIQDIEVYFYDICKFLSFLKSALFISSQSRS